MKKLIVKTFLFSIIFASFAFTTYQNWKIKSNYSIKFNSKDASGVFESFKGNISFDANDLANSKFDLKIDVESIATGNFLQNRHAKNSDWFNADKYPYIKFTSEKIEKTSSGYDAVGTMEMHGIKKQIRIPFTFQGHVFKASFSVDRTDYKIGDPSNGVDKIIKIDASIPVSKA